MLKSLKSMLAFLLFLVGLVGSVECTCWPGELQNCSWSLELER
jgi:hypothetical protein